MLIHHIIILRISVFKTNKTLEYLKSIYNNKLTPFMPFDRLFMRGSDDQFNSLVSCSGGCVDEIVEEIKLNFVDRILNRTKLDKAVLLCNYNCIKQLKYNNCKYNGRWIFMSLLGFTELLSSGCALLKFIINLSYYKKLVRISRGSPLRVDYLIHYGAMSLAFISSFLFHLHETVLTRNMDYFTAVFTIAMSALVTTQRNILILISINKKNRQSGTELPKCYYVLKQTVRIIFVTGYVYHVYRMLYIDFNYKYNMVVCGILLCLIQLNYLITTVYYKNKHIKDKIVTLTNLIIISGVFELSDFPPLFYLMDSHFLWHAGLLLSIKPFYKFTFLEAKLYRKMFNRTKETDKRK
ncbi:PER1 [Enterospora canceri]|uniref:Post-GPI attachment to proteins factor 3 n=1 Tax=Enterospora canceri TaxID=1081671 RepID=A0A1Y1S8A6_9MICR|nr:PER1 [Enterospora canceri]